MSLAEGPKSGVLLKGTVPVLPGVSNAPALRQGCRKSFLRRGNIHPNFPKSRYLQYILPKIPKKKKKKKLETLITSLISEKTEMKPCRNGQVRWLETHGRELRQFLSRKYPILSSPRVKLPWVGRKRKIGGACKIKIGFSITFGSRHDSCLRPQISMFNWRYGYCFPSIIWVFARN